MTRRERFILISPNKCIEYTYGIFADYAITKTDFWYSIWIIVHNEKYGLEADHSESYREVIIARFEDETSARQFTNLLSTCC